MKTGKMGPAITQAEKAASWPGKCEATPVQTDELAAVPVKARTNDDGVVQIGGPLTDEAAHYERLQDICGTRSDDWMNGIVRGLTNAAGGAKDADSAATLLEGLAFLNGVGPRDEVEAA